MRKTLISEINQSKLPFKEDDLFACYGTSIGYIKLITKSNGGYDIPYFDSVKAIDKDSYEGDAILLFRYLGDRICQEYFTEKLFYLDGNINNEQSLEVQELNEIRGIPNIVRLLKQVKQHPLVVKLPNSIYTGLYNVGNKEFRDAFFKQSTETKMAITKKIEEIENRALEELDETIKQDINYTYDMSWEDEEDYEHRQLLKSFQTKDKPKL